MSAGNESLIASANMSIGSSRQQSHRGAHMENMLSKIRNAASPTHHLQTTNRQFKNLSSFVASPQQVVAIGHFQQLN